MNRLLLTTAVLLSGAQLASGQASQRTADSVMALNRLGHWSTAAVLARHSLQGDESGKVTASRCQLLSSLLWAETRLRKTSDARATLATYDSGCSRLPAMRSFAPEIARVRRELGAKTASQGTE